MNKSLHIVCLDAPAPPDYGGAIEMYYKIKSLAQEGIAITLHYFDYKKGRHTKNLEPYCVQIYRYKRKSFFQALPFSKPHIVVSRINSELIDRLNQDEHPVLLEGIHCTGILPYLKNKARKILVRLHNDEALYYDRLAETENNFFKRAFYKRESRLLQQYQRNLSNSISYAALSQQDAKRFSDRYGLKSVSVVPAFVMMTDVTSVPGKGTFCLYQGNLSVAENEAAARWMIHNIFSKLSIPLVIAGKNIPDKLRNSATAHSHIMFVSNPSDTELNQLIEQAHIHALPDFNQTGIKLKLLHALFGGRFCITNNQELEPNTSLAIAQTPEEYMRVLKSFWSQPFTEAHLIERKKLLHSYDNAVNARVLIARLY